jgi:hypothetical protein
VFRPTASEPGTAAVAVLVVCVVLDVVVVVDGACVVLVVLVVLAGLTVGLAAVVAGLVVVGLAVVLVVCFVLVVLEAVLVVLEAVLVVLEAVLVVCRTVVVVDAAVLVNGPGLLRAVRASGLWHFGWWCLAGLRQIAAWARTGARCARCETIGEATATDTAAADVARTAAGSGAMRSLMQFSSARPATARQ